MGEGMVGYHHSHPPRARQGIEGIGTLTGPDGINREGRAEAPREGARLRPSHDNPMAGYVTSLVQSTCRLGQHGSLDRRAGVGAARALRSRLNLYILSATCPGRSWHRPRRSSPVVSIMTNGIAFVSCLGFLARWEGEANRVALPTPFPKPRRWPAPQSGLAMSWLLCDEKSAREFGFRLAAPFFSFLDARNQGSGNGSDPPAERQGMISSHT